MGSIAVKKRKTPVQKNELVDVTFDDLSHEGAGVAKIDGYTIFVPKALPGERGIVKVVKVNKGYGFGRLMELTEKSEERTTPVCSVYNECGGCQLQHFSYEGQLKQKEKIVRNALERIGGITEATIHPILGMKSPWNYRNKAQVPFAEREGGLVAGFYQERSHRIIEMDRCFIQHEENDQVVQTVKQIAKNLGIPADNEEKHNGCLRHVVVRYGANTGETMIVLVTRTEEIPNKQKLLEQLQTELPNVTSIVQNINNRNTNVIFGEKTNVLYGEQYIYDYIDNIKFAISARSFFQVNPEQTKVLYEKTLEYAELTGNETVIDAYCGIGTISLFLAQQARHVYGVEIVPEAISDAKLNAKLNNIDNVTFAVGEAERTIPWWYAQGIRTDVIVVDPPRKGCDEKLLETLIAMKPKRVVYVSCNPATLARDLQILEKGGFRTTEVQPVDMFPQTMHVETITLLQRQTI